MGQGTGRNIIIIERKKLYLKSCKICQRLSLLKVHILTSPVLSYSAATGIISSLANLRAVAWNSFCCSVNSKRKLFLKYLNRTMNWENEVSM